MRNLKKFIESKSFVFTIVTFEYEEYVKALYIDGVLEFYGDYYHNKISEKISAFIEGAEWAGANIQVSKIKCNNQKLNEDICEGGAPPNSLEEVK